MLLGCFIHLRSGISLDSKVERLRIIVDIYSITDWFYFTYAPFCCQYYVSHNLHDRHSQTGE